MEINIEQLASDLNNKEINKKQVLEKYSIKDKAMRILLKQNGYTYNQKSKQWQLESENTYSKDETKVTYRIPVELYKAVKLQAIFEGIIATDIIVKALNDYIPQSTKDIIKENNK